MKIQVITKELAEEFKDIENILMSYKPLYQWFLDNQEIILSEKEEDKLTIIEKRIRVMAKIGLAWLRNSNNEYPEARIVPAVIAMTQNYETFKNDILREIENETTDEKEREDKIKRIALTPYKAQRVA